MIEPLNLDIAKPTLLCLDFDLTLTKSHLFGYVVDAIQGGFSRENALLRAMKILDAQGVKGGQQFWQFLARWLTAGHGLVITSYTSFPELPTALLAKGIPELRKLGVPKQYVRWISRPIIVYGDPAPHLNPPRPLPNTYLISQDLLKAEASGKNLHIQEALKQVQTRGYHYHQALLLDDDPQNIEYAQMAQIQTIQVSKKADDLSHIEILNSLI